MSDLSVENKKTKKTPVVEFLKAFKTHPESVNETYFQHLFFASKFAFELLTIAAAALIHAIIPPLFEKTASTRIKAICARFDARQDDAAE